MTLFTYFITNRIFAWSETTWYIDLTCGRIYSSICSAIIYDMNIYCIFSSRVTIYGIVINYIYRASCIRYDRVIIWIHYDIRRNNYLQCSCFTVSSASFLTYFISNSMFAWRKTSWYIDLTCSRIYSSSCSTVVCYRNIYIVFGSRVAIYSYIVKNIYRATCLRYTFRITCWDHYRIACYLYSSCVLLTCLSCSCSVITYFVHYGIITCWGSLWYYNLTSISTCGDEAWYDCTCSRSYHTYSYIVWSRVSGSSIEAYIV